jgi:uncharacterized membrane protein
MDHPVVLFVLRAIHVVGGILWVGGVVLTTTFLLPAAQAAGPAGQSMMKELMRRKMTVYLIVVANLTVLAGIALYGMNMSATGGAWGHSPTGIGIGVGAVCGIIAVVIGMSVSSPSAKRLAAAGATLSDAERARLIRRLNLASKAVLTLLAVAALTMATARYY